VCRIAPRHSSGHRDRETVNLFTVRVFALSIPRPGSVVFCYEDLTNFEDVKHS